MTLFKKKKKPSTTPIYYTLDTELIRARRQEKTSFYYPLKENEVDKAMTWGIRNRVGIQIDHITEGKIYYKFFGYSMEE